MHRCCCEASSLRMAWRIYVMEVELPHTHSQPTFCFHNRLVFPQRNGSKRILRKFQGNLSISHTTLLPVSRSQMCAITILKMDDVSNQRCSLRRSRGRLSATFIS
ncbi:hypothetical protein C345_00618 [Cryptococcus neoformans A2-102-5]|nr:hypothetical protein C345_00618 [Cryptococcus neoformans var. grubii A2-102-5]